MKKVFVSYVHENTEDAKKIFERLKTIPGIVPWFDKECLKPGLRWKPAIRKEIRNSNYVVALLSKHCESKIGFFQSEMKEALDVLSQFPEDKPFIIPIRIEDCSVPYEQLKEIQYVDFFPNWENGFNKLLSALEESRPSSDISYSASIEITGIQSKHDYKCGIIDIDTELKNIPQICDKFNSIQSYFYFEPKITSIIIDQVRFINGIKNLYLNGIPRSFYEEKKYLDVDLVACFSKYPIAIKTGNLVYSNHFSSPGPLDNRFMFISTDMLKNITERAGCTFEKGISQIIVSQLLVYFTDLGYHDETRGCVMDYCKNRMDLIKGLQSKLICSQCNAIIKDQKLKSAVLSILKDDMKI